MESRKAVECAKALMEVEVCKIVHEFRKLRPHLTNILNDGKLSIRSALIISHRVIWRLKSNGEIGGPIYVCVKI